MNDTAAIFHSRSFAGERGDWASCFFADPSQIPCCSKCTVVSVWYLGVLPWSEESGGCFSSQVPAAVLRFQDNCSLSSYASVNSQIYLPKVMVREIWSNCIFGQDISLLTAVGIFFSLMSLMSFQLLRRDTKGQVFSSVADTKLSRNFMSFASWKGYSCD